MIALKDVKDEHRDEFEFLLKRLDSDLNLSPNPINFDSKLWKDLAPTEYEDELYVRLKALVKESSLSYEIEQIGGQKFPDLVAWVEELRGFGVEAKSTKKDHWRSVGSSIMESTREANVERIYLSFAKLGGSPQFKTKHYPDCLSDVAVTHSPRYLIDMQLEDHQSIFSKIGTSYDVVSTSDKPFLHFKDYYEDKHQGSWWVESEEKTTNPVIQFFSSLPTLEKEEWRKRLFIKCPKVVGNLPDKYNEAAIVLMQYSFVHPSLRDLFSSSGKKQDSWFGTDLKLPAAVFRLSEWVVSDEFTKELQSLKPHDFSSYDWCQQIREQIATYKDEKSFKKSAVLRKSLATFIDLFIKKLEQKLSL